MSIDTSFERRMAASLLPIHKVPLPSGDIDIYDRVHIGWLWGGLIPVTAQIALHASKRVFTLYTDARQFALHTYKRAFALHTSIREFTLRAHKRIFSLNARGE